MTAGRHRVKGHPVRTPLDELHARRAWERAWWMGHARDALHDRDPLAAALILADGATVLANLDTQIAQATR